MIVQCAECGTKFRLEESKIGQRGAKVRCSKCQHSFVVQRPPAIGLDLGTDPNARARVELAGAAPPAGSNQAGTAQGAGFAIDQPTTDLTSVPNLGARAPAAQPLTTDPSLPALPEAPAAPGVLLGGPELPDLPGASELPELPPAESKDPIHEVQTAVYTVPDAIREASQAEQEASGSGAVVPPGLSAQEVAAIDLEDDDATGVVPPEVLAQAKAAAAAESHDGIPSAEADLIDDDEVTLVSDGEDPVAGRDALPGDPFASAASGSVVAPGSGDPFAPPGDPSAAEDLFSGEGALGRIQPAVIGGDSAPAPVDRAPATPGLAALDDAVPTVVESKSGEGSERKGWSLGVKLVTTLIGVAILGAGVLLWIGGGRLDLSLVGVGNEAGKAAAHYRGVHPVAMRSVLYPTRGGKEVLVFVGRAENRADEARTHVAAVAELRNRRGELVTSARAPVGIALSPAFVADLTDRQSLDDAYAVLAREQGEPRLASKAVAPFTVVFLQPPKGLADLEHTVRLAKGEPVLAPEPTPAEPVEEAEVEAEEGDERKGKRKRKGKRRRRKAKTRAEE